MLLNELKYIVFFDYIKDIRKYLYEFEIYLKEQNLYSEMYGSPQIPDEADPFLGRLHIVKELENKKINIVISQISLTVAVQYSDDFDFKYLDSEIDETKEHLLVVKEYLKSSIDSFKINFESLAIVSVGLHDNIKSIKTTDISPNQDENRTKISTEINNELFFVEDTSIYKTYKQTQNIVSPILAKNKPENFIGWSEVLIKEVNNRLSYNNQNNEDEQHNELNIDNAIKIIKKGFENEKL